MESTNLVCELGYTGGGRYECDVSLSHYMRGDSVCEPRECVQYLENVQSPSQQPIHIYYQDTIDVLCLPGHVGGGLWSCGPTGELYGGTNCTRNFCDVPVVANSDFDTVIRPYLPYPPYDLRINITCDPEHDGGGFWFCNPFTGTFEGEHHIRNGRV